MECSITDSASGRALLRQLLGDSILALSDAVATSAVLLAQVAVNAPPVVAAALHHAVVVTHLPVRMTDASATTTAATVTVAGAPTTVTAR
jgi:hypothetical protein